MNRAFLFFLFLIVLPTYTFAQQKVDAMPQKKDTSSVSIAKDSASNIITLKDTVSVLTPKKTGLYSALVPGLGQYYNKHYWKIPVIYAGLGVAAYVIYDNTKNYNLYRTEYAAKINGKGSDDVRFKNMQPEEFEYNIDYYQRNRDLAYIFTGVFYALQIVDAVVFAHLKGFDISEDISFRVRPIVMPQGGYGFWLALNF